jgi:hypothetical protein
MAYQVDRFNGTFLTSVDDGTIDTTTDLRLVGKNYAGYGELQNENFVHLLENFSNTTPPPKAISGQIWYDSLNKKLKFYDGIKFKTASGAEVGSSAPTGLQIGDFWFDTSSDQLRIWNGDRFVIIGPEIPDELSANAVLPVIVKDTLDQNHPIVKISSGSDVIAVISKDAFTLNSAVNPITGFSVIKKGINLVNTSGTTGVTTTDHYFWGTSSNALKLGGFDANTFVRFGEVSFDEEVNFKDAGFTVGDQNDLRINVENGDETIIENRLGNPIFMRIRVSGSDRRDVGIFTPFGIIPGSDNSFNLGSTSVKWQAVYATTFNGSFSGNLIGNSTGVHTGDIRAGDSSTAFNSSTKTFYGTFGGPEPENLSTFYGSLVGDVQGTATNALTLNSLTGSQSATPISIVVRDSSGNITANRFIGVTDRSDRLRINNSAVDSDPNYRSAKTTSTANTIVARDGSANINANLFNGTATAARYADLAEKYLADQDYEVGTVVSIGGEKEVRAASDGDRAIGVVSKNPAFMMNSELDGGTYIALKGRVPVYVTGKVKKGDRLVSGDSGVAKVATFENYINVFAISLEDSNDENQKIIECLIL